MKKFTFQYAALSVLFFFMLNKSQVNAQNQNWLWAKSAGGSAKDQGFSVINDAGGNTYVTGFFSGPSMSFGTVTVNSSLGHNVFVTKYDPNGAALWAKAFGGSSDDEAYSICTDPSGNIFVAGQFSNSAMTAGSTTLTNAGKSDMFVIKLDASGNVLWARSAGGNNTDEAIAVTCDPFGNLFVTGDFTSPSIAFETTTLTNSNSYEDYVVKYDPSGNVLWAKLISSSGLDLVGGICTDVGGNVFVCGNAGNSIVNVGSTTFTLNPGTNMVVIKIDQFGSAQWLRSCGGNGNQFARAITCVAGGAVLMCGDFDGSMVSLGTNTFSNQGSRNIFAIAYSGSGNQLWAKTFGGSGTEFGLACYGETGGNAYIGGYFTSPTVSAGAYTLTNSGSEDIFLAKVDYSGNVLWLKSNTSTGTEIVSDICSDPAGNIWVTGSFCGSSVTFSNTTIACNGVLDIYTAKLSGGGGVSVGVKDSEKNEAITFYPNPFSEKIHFQFAGHQTNASLKIRNSIGIVVAEFNNLQGDSFDLLRGDLPCGIYFYSYSDNAQNEQRGNIVVIDSQ